MCIGPKCARASLMFSAIEDSEAMSPWTVRRFGLAGSVLGRRSCAVTLHPCAEVCCQTLCSEERSTESEHEQTQQFLDDSRANSPCRSSDEGVQTFDLQE